jgi:hypothetical protein
LHIARSSLDVVAAACETRITDLLAAVTASARDWRTTLDS